VPSCNRQLVSKTQQKVSNAIDVAATMGWTKDLAVAIRQATNAKLIQESVQQECNNSHQNATETVLVAATIGMNVILGHRKGLMRITDIDRSNHLL